MAHYGVPPSSSRRPQGGKRRSRSWRGTGRMAGVLLGAVLEEITAFLEEVTFPMLNAIYVVTRGTIVITGMVALQLADIIVGQMGLAKLFPTAPGYVTWGISAGTSAILIVLWDRILEGQEEGFDLTTIPAWVLGLADATLDAMTVTVLMGLADKPTFVDPRTLGALGVTYVVVMAIVLVLSSGSEGLTATLLKSLRKRVTAVA